MPRQLGPGGNQLPRHMGPPGPKIGGDPHACDTGISVVAQAVFMKTLIQVSKNMLLHVEKNSTLCLTQRY